MKKLIYLIYAHNQVSDLWIHRKFKSLKRKDNSDLIMKLKNKEKRPWQGLKEIENKKKDKKNLQRQQYKK